MKLGGWSRLQVEDWLMLLVAVRKTRRLSLPNPDMFDKVHIYSRHRRRQRSREEWQQLYVA